MAENPLSFLGEGSNVTGIYRFISSVLLGVLTVTVGLVGFFARDELESFKAAQTAIINEVKEHIAADIGSRESINQRVNLLDIRTTRIEQARDDLSKQATNNHQENAVQIANIESTLVNIQRELSVLEGRLSVSPATH